MVQNKTSPLFTILALVATAGVSVADMVLPPQIETIFFYTFPVLLCARSGHIRLPYLITAVAVAWTAAVTAIELTAEPQPTFAILYEALNDLFGVFSVMGLAWFVSARMQRERDLLDVIRFVDTRLQFGDNERVARMVALMNGIPNAPERTSATEGAAGR